MRQLYRKLIQVIKNQFYWLLDYVYVVRQQAIGFIKRYNAEEYLNARSAKPPVVLLPGIYEKWHFMKPIADLLYKEGYSVHVVESLGYNTGYVEDMASRVEEYARTHHIDSYVIVAHSKGGLVAKYLLRSKENSIRKVIAVNTPFGGSKYAGFFPFASIRSFLPTSEVLTLLADDRLPNKKITSIYALFDPHIPGGSYLEGATNIQVNTRGHFRIMSNRNVHAVILDSIAKD